MIRIVEIDELGNTAFLPYLFLRGYADFETKGSDRKIIFVQDDSLSVFPVRIWKNKFLKVLQPLFPPLDPKGNRLNIEEERVFLNEFILFVKGCKLADRIVQPENAAIFHAVPDNSVYAPFGTYYLDLRGGTEEELFANVHSKHRNVIRNAEKHGILIRYGKECLPDFYSLYAQTMKRSGMYCQDISYFENFYTMLPENIICGVAYHEDRPQGGVFMPYSIFGAFYLYGSSLEKIEVNGALNFLHWCTVKMLKAKGVKRYDFVGARLSDVSGTKLDGIQQFKERFGAVLDKGYLWKMDIDKSKCLIFDALLAAKNVLRRQDKLLDIIDQELRKGYAG